jgi:hypothetical protein
MIGGVEVTKDDGAALDAAPAGDADIDDLASLKL